MQKYKHKNTRSADVKADLKYIQMVLVEQQRHLDTAPLVLSSPQLTSDICIPCMLSQ